MEIHELRGDQTHLVEQALWIYRESFPVEERDPEELLLEEVRRRNPDSAEATFHFQVALEGEAVLGMAIFTYYRPARMGFIPYLAVHPRRRGGGVGAQIYRQIIATTVEDARQAGKPAPLGICFEVERPELARDPADEDLRRRRMDFYRRNGALEVQHLNLVAPPLGPGLPEVAYAIMLHPLAGFTALTRARIAAVVDTVLCHGYGLPPDSSYHRRALGSLELYE